MSEKLSWGILATGAIAKAFAGGVRRSKTGRLAAVGSRTQASADAFGQVFDIPADHLHGSYEALLADPTVQAVYIATPHPLHAHWAIQAARAGKHLLVEKPIGLNHAEAMAIVESAVENDVFLMEAYMYRCHPQTRKVVELIRDGAIGQVRTIQASFSFHWPKPFKPETRLTSNAMAGGGILDVGGYPVSFARLIAGVASGQSFANPIEVKAVGHLGQTGVDEWSSAVLKFGGGIMAQVSAGVQVNQENVARVYGTDGWLLVQSPWVPAKEGGATTIIVHRADEKSPREIIVETDEWLYGIEADTVATHLAKRQADSPAMSWDDTLGNMKTLDAWREQIGLTYESEKPVGYRRTTISGATLAVSREAKMTYGSIPGIEKKISRLVIGCDNQRSFPHAAVMFDDFFSRGGTAFDTAHIYGGGLPERLFGQWIKHRGVREQIVVIVKGAHTPFCTPTDLTRQLYESFDRLGIDYADLYLMHRDNLAIPVGEFVDVLNEHQSAGRIKAFGGSNWSLSRVQEANEYAKRAGKAPLAAVSNNFSLARMIEAPWPGCLSASDRASREWFTKTQTPLLAWSSQARGFFLPGNASPNKTDDAELVRCWYSEDNFERLKRVNELAEKRKVLPINIAAAYVLNQPFPTFALIGPRALSETRTSVPAVDIALSADEVAWLNLER